MKGDAHSLDAHDFQNFEAGLFEEIGRWAVDAHTAADLVDEIQFFVGIGEVSGERIQFSFQAAEAKLIFVCSEHQACLSLNLLFAVGDKFLGLLTKPGSVESEPAADAEDFLGEVEIAAAAGN